MLIQNLAIQNFKSIQNLHLTGFNRINLFIGRPNVGKSNIIEALSLFSLSYLIKLNSSKPSFKHINTLVRCENITELFYDGDVRNNIFVKTDLGEIHIKPNLLQKIENEQGFALSILCDMLQDNSFAYLLDSYLRFSIDKNRKNNNKVKPVIKAYRFSTNVHYKQENLSFLLPPLGNNLVQTLDFLPELKANLIHIFSEYGLKLVFDKASQSLKIMKEQKDGSVFLLPYSSIADTLQRIIFYKTAVASNQNSVLLFEEPEAHAFPPYIVEITQEIIRSKTNQFFITTHSPFIVNDFLENAIDDLAIFMLDYKDGQTTAKALTKEQLREVYEYGVDLFTNNENYL
jgi:AAA15 family ATPase/GTPase